MEERGEGAKLYDGEKAWSSEYIKYSLTIVLSLYLLMREGGRGWSQFEGQPGRLYFFLPKLPAIL